MRIPALCPPLAGLALSVALAAAADAGGENPACGVPVSGSDAPVASDALFVLRTAVGSETCPLCICDVDDSGMVNTTDALFDLKSAVGQAVALNCPACETTTTTTTTTLPCSTDAPDVPPLRIIAVNATSATFAPFAAQPPGSTDWYIVEQGGRIRIVRNGQFLAKAFLDITPAMGSNLNERGLLGLAFHPDYATNGRFFTMGTPGNNSDGTYAPANADAVVEWVRSGSDPDLAVTTKVRDIVVLPASDTNHNGGTILFGPDGYLYVGTGDGGGGCESDKPGAVQDTTKLFGKILRLNVDASPPFAAPGNPFANDSRVYHYGLRNPFRFGFDSLTHDLWIGDVGQESYEEISFVAAGSAGRNFGWPAFEGSTQGTCGSKPLGGPSPHTPPVLAIDRRVGSDDPFSDYSSIVGGRVYRGDAIPSLRGVYLFADFGGQELGAMRSCDGQASDATAVPLSEIPTNAGVLSAISSIIEGNDGELYVTYGFGTRIGRIAPQ